MEGGKRVNHLVTLDAKKKQQVLKIHKKKSSFMKNYAFLETKTKILPDRQTFWRQLFQM